MEEFERECKILEEQGLKDNPLRLEYERKVRELKKLPEKLAGEGHSEEEIARRLHDIRRELGRQYKEAAPPLFREYIYAATAARYGDPLGPDYDTLRKKKTPRQIIESASRPIKDLNDRLTVGGFRQWYISSGRDRRDK